MRFKVPQFIDIEDKIFGPFSFKQFVYLAGGAGLCYIFFKTLPVCIRSAPSPTARQEAGTGQRLTARQISSSTLGALHNSVLRSKWMTMTTWKMIS